MTRRLLVSLFIDALGSGLLGPVLLLYGNVIIGLPLVPAGLALSVAAVGSIAVGPLAGAYADRWGPRTLMVVGNVLGSAGCAGLLFAADLTTFTFASFLLSASVRIFWACLAPLLTSLIKDGHVERAFAGVRATRLIGYSLGGVVAAPLLTLGLPAALRTLVALDAASFVVAAALLRAVPATPTAAVRKATPSSYRFALADRANLGLAILNVGDVVLTTAPLVAMPVLIASVLRLAPSLIGILSAESAIVVGAATILSGRLLRGQRRLLVLATANGIWLLAYVLMAVLADPATAAIGLVLGLGLAGIAEGAYSLTADAIPVTIAPVGLAGRYTALHQMAWGISETLVPTVVALLIGLSVGALWLVLGLLATFNAVSYVVLEPVIGARVGRAATRAEV